MIQFKSLVIYVFTVFVLTACGSTDSTYSFRESAIVNNIPEDIRNYSGGIIKSPSDSEVERAILFGQESKESDELTYAYIFKPDVGFLNTTYVSIETPLHLISRHAKNQAREYSSLDEAYIEFLRELNAVNLSLTSQELGPATYNVYTFDHEIILLRDGIKVEPLSKVASWNNMNPFAYNEALAQQLANINQMTAASTTAVFAQMPEEQKKKMIEVYKAAGVSNQYIESAFELEETGVSNELNYISTLNAIGKQMTIYSIDELKKPGRYEIVYRTRANTNLFSGGGKNEVRFDISFANYR